MTDADSFNIGASMPSFESESLRFTMNEIDALSAKYRGHSPSLQQPFLTGETPSSALSGGDHAVLGLDSTVPSQCAGSSSAVKGRPHPANNLQAVIRRRGFYRKKARREDRRRKRELLAISRSDYYAGIAAAREADMIGLPLDTLVTVRPVEIDKFSPQERERFFKLRLASLSKWLVRQGLPATYIWSRESLRVGPAGRRPKGRAEHLHVLLHAAHHAGALARMLTKSASDPCMIDVRPASSSVRQLRNGQLGTAATYILKACAPNVYYRRPTIPHRPSGPIFGKRTGMSANLSQAVRGGR